MQYASPFVNFVSTDESEIYIFQGYFNDPYLNLILSLNDIQQFYICMGLIMSKKYDTLNLLVDKNVNNLLPLIQNVLINHDI